MIHFGPFLTLLLLAKNTVGANFSVVIFAKRGVPTIRNSLVPQRGSAGGSPLVDHISKLSFEGLSIREKDCKENLVNVKISNVNNRQAGY